MPWEKKETNLERSQWNFDLEQIPGILIGFAIRKEKTRYNIKCSALDLARNEVSIPTQQAQRVAGGTSIEMYIIDAFRKVQRAEVRFELPTC